MMIPQDMKNLEWTIKELAAMPGDIVSKLILTDYSNGNIERALALIKESAIQNPNPSYGFRIGDIKKEIVSKNDLDTLSKLKDIAPNWYGGHQAKDSGGICAAIVTQNSIMLKALVEAGTKLDFMSSSEASKLSSDPRLGLVSYSDKSFQAKSAFYWASALNDVEAVKTVLTLADHELIKYQRVEKKGPRGGFHGYGKEVQEDVWGVIVRNKSSAVAQFLFDQPEFQKLIIENTFPKSKESEQGLKLLSASQQKIVWDSFEVSTDLNGTVGHSVASLSWNANSYNKFRHNLILNHPDKYIKYATEFLVQKPTDCIYTGNAQKDWWEAIECGSMDVVRFIEKGYPFVKDAKKEEFPGDTRRIKRMVGPLLKALYSNQSEAALYFASQPGILEAETPMIKEYFLKGWMLPKGYRIGQIAEQKGITVSHEKSKEFAAEQFEAIKSLWENINLKARVQSSPKVKKELSAL